MITLEAINQINQLYLQRMNEIEAMKVQTKHVPADIEFKQKVVEVMQDRPIMWVTCPDCEGLGGHTEDCGCFSQRGCVWCHGEGVIHHPCKTCDGQKEVPVYADEGLEVFK